jgi:uncharacterized protein (DUF2225 family)
MADSSLKVSYYLKNPVICPLCSTTFKKEELLSGGGRLIATDTTDELRRIYQPSRKFGEVNPLSYPVTVCPNCLYAAFSEDFPHVMGEYVPAALSQKGKRAHDIGLIFPSLDFTRPRDLMSGTASYLLAVSSYSFHNPERAPTFRKGLASLRCAWLFGDLNEKLHDKNYDTLMITMYRKAIGYYEKTISYAQDGRERIDSVKHMGPDLDKNYGFQGVLYLYTLLLYKYGKEDDLEARIQKLTASKRIISKVFGSGKSSKSKPSFILEISRELYDKLSEKVEELKGA